MRVRDGKTLKTVHGPRLSGTGVLLSPSICMKFLQAVWRGYLNPQTFNAMTMSALPHSMVTS